MKTNLPSPKNEKGFSLIELLIVSVVMLIVLGIMATIVSGVQSNYRNYRQRAEKHTDALASLKLITKIIRNAGDNSTQTALTATGNNRLQIKTSLASSNEELADEFGNVEFYSSNNILYIVTNGAAPVELSQNVQAIKFDYFDANGAVTTNMTNVARVRVTVTMANESQPLIEVATVRKMIQPK